MKKGWLVTAGVLASIALIMLSCMSFAWYGEVASQQEKIELEFRDVFVMLVYLLLYGTYQGTQVDVGLLRLFDNFQALVLMNPPLDYEMIHGIIRYSVIVLEPLYLTAVLATGAYLIFFSGSPESRNKAKSLLLKMLASIVVVSLSTQILQVLFNISYNLSTGIIGLSKTNMQTIFMDTINDLVKVFSVSAITTFDGGYVFLLLIFFLIMTTFIILAMRYIILLFFVLLFPLGIFFYTFSMTRSIGRTIIEQIILWTFMPVAVTMIIVTANIGINLFVIGGDLKTIMGITAFIAVAASPIILVAMIKRFLP